MNLGDYGWVVPLGLVAAFVLYQRLSRVSVEEARRLVKEGARLVDVRSPGEFSGGHLPGAINLPVGELAARVAALGPKDSPLVLYCASGARSALARTMLRRAGFTRVFNLGAMSRW